LVLGDMGTEEVKPWPTQSTENTKSKTRNRKSQVGSISGPTLSQWLDAKDGMLDGVCALRIGRK